MSVTCYDLLSLKYFSRIELLAGKSGLNRVITWPYVGQTASVSAWVHGGELLFITGIAHSEEMLPSLLDECIHKKLSGLVVLIGDEYIQKIPQVLVEQAEAAGFPLFSMPYKVKLIDVTKEITDLIVCDQLERKKEQGFLGRLLFSTEIEVDKVLETVLLDGISIDKFSFVAIFRLSSEALAQQQALEEKLQQHISSLCSMKKISIYSIIYGSSVVCLIFSQSQDDAAKAINYLETARDTISQMCGDEKLLLALGRIYDNNGMRNSYQEACSAIELANRLGSKKIVQYQKLGIYRLLLQIKNTDELREYYRYNLDTLLKYDEKNTAALLPTLKVYLLCNGNIAKTAQQLFIHRNTLLYRLNQLRELLCCDFDDAWVRMDLFTSILVKEYLGE